MTHSGRLVGAGIYGQNKDFRVNRHQRKDLVEVIGLVAIVGSLIFLGVEIRQNTAALEASQLNFLTDLNDRWYSDQVASPEIYDLWIKLENDEPLTKAELYRLQDQIWRSFVIWEELYERHARGLIKDDIYQLEAAGMVNWVLSTVPPKMWTDIRNWSLNPELIELVDAAYAKQDD